MNPDELKKLQSIKIIISEVVMVLAVIVTVIILALLVSGYWLNSDFKVERQGMLQIYSTPTGADVEIDGETSWLQRTNTSKVLSSGEHTITLTREGYDSWSRTVTISEGLLYRIHYPRLFLEQRSIEKTLDVTATTAASFSADHSNVLLMNGTTEWSLVNLDAENLSPQKIDISQVFSSVSLAPDATIGLFTGEVLDIDWDYDAAHVLVKAKTEDNIEWALLDLKNSAKSVNLTKEFHSNFNNIVILDNSSNTLMALADHNLRKIDVPGRQISAVLAENVVSYDHHGNEIVFSASLSTNDSPEYYIGLFKVDDNKITQLETMSAPAQVVISKFYDEKYITVLSGNLVSVHQKDDYSASTTYDLNFTPEQMEVGHNGEFITMFTGPQIATLDMEASSIYEWSVNGSTFGWLDNDMIYSVSDGELIVYDFNGLNRRELAKNVSSHFPVGITSDKWLYYFSDGYLVREWLIPR